MNFYCRQVAWKLNFRPQIQAAMVPSLDAHRFLKASMQLCSWNANWRSILLREYKDAPDVEEFTTAPAPDYYISLVTSGPCEVQRRMNGRWHATRKQLGTVGFRAPGYASTMRWNSDEPHQTLQLHLPTSFFDQENSDISKNGTALPSTNGYMEDPLIVSVMLALKENLMRGASDLYAETAAQFLAVHLLQRHAGARPSAFSTREDKRLRRADEFLRSNLAKNVSLADIAQIAGVSRFHLLRLFKSAYGETPLKHLTRLRIAKARHLLVRNEMSITEIGLECGYSNPANFAAAFHRNVGVCPSAFRIR